MPVGPKRVIACLKSSKHSATLISHANVLGDAFNVPLTLLQVLESSQAHMVKTDPFEWDLLCREARSSLCVLAESLKSKYHPVDSQLTEGHVAEAIIGFANSYPEDLLVLGVQDDRSGDGHCVGGKLHSILHEVTGSVLLVPMNAPVKSYGYKRIAVPLDGSCWSESVLPMAVRMAHAQDAELVLVHVIPTPELMSRWPLEQEDLELRRLVIKRNDMAAREYLKLLQIQLASQVRHVSVLLTQDDDVREALLEIFVAESADLVVMSATGQGRTNSTGARYGHVTSYLMSHAKVPVLIALPQPATATSNIIPLRNEYHSRLSLVGPG